MAGRLAFARLILGAAQMIGATLSFVLLGRRGVTPVSLIVVVTGMLTTISVLVFGNRGRSTQSEQKSGGEKHL
jgi:hypothetical protein